MKIQKALQSVSDVAKTGVRNTSAAARSKPPPTRDVYEAPAQAALNRNRPEMGEQAALRNSNSNATALSQAPDPEKLSQKEKGALCLTPEYQNMISVLSQEKNFDMLDTAAKGGKKDGKISEKDLRAGLDNRSFPQEVRDVCRYLLTNKAAFNQLDTAAGKGGLDGIISKEDLTAERNKLVPPPGVSGTYNVATGELTLTDPNRIDPKTGKPMEITGQFHSGKSGTSSLDPDNVGPIPDGVYDILYRTTGDGFRLEPVDNSYGDDAVDGTGRGTLRLHGPGGSIGCITSDDTVEEWEAIRSFIEDAETDKVKVDYNGRNPLKNDESLTRYGRIEVINAP